MRNTLLYTSYLHVPHFPQAAEPITKPCSNQMISQQRRRIKWGGYDYFHPKLSKITVNCVNAFIKRGFILKKIIKKKKRPGPHFSSQGVVA